MGSRKDSTKMICFVPEMGAQACIIHHRDEGFIMNQRNVTNILGTWVSLEEWWSTVCTLYLHSQDALLQNKDNYTFKIWSFFFFLGGGC